MNSTRKICQENTDRRAEIIKKRVENNFWFYKFLAGLVAIIAVIYLYYPIYSYVFNGKLVPFIPVEFMFVDHTTNVGFLIGTIFQAILGIYAISGDVYMIFAFIYIVMDYSIRVDIIKIDFNELDDLWSDTSTFTSSYRLMYLRNICWKFIDMNRYFHINLLIDCGFCSHNFRWRCRHYRMGNKQYNF